MSARPIVDAAERALALDPEVSSIVQAPAGSGKTGLLIQRYLRLLGRVARPEEILAITFTRKAAAEMRRRVLEALQRAARSATEPVPTDPNAQLTHGLAKAALDRDAELGWAILDNPARLRIQTIDSLSATLARQLPVLSGLGAPPAIVDDPRELYREAAERTLAMVDGADAVSSSIARVLDHLDGDWGTARLLLEDMLGKRDQWLPRVGEFHGDAAPRKKLEAAFRVERARVMAAAHVLLPRELASELTRLARHAGANLRVKEPDSLIARLVDLAELPQPDETGAEAWCAIATLLLKQDGEVRGTVDVRQGFPKEDKATKENMLALLGQVAGVPGLCERLDALRGMPPAAYSEEQWAALGAVVAMLPVAAAQLTKVFAARGEIDFTGIAQHAVQALGTPEAPTDLLLALDTRIQHLLVDEFQDTSHAQWMLLDRLTAGWQPGDGRTVFLVGDPMQSIYRFREADVALFLRARREGLPQVPLESIRIRTNFRSRAGIVDWVNTHFPHILRADDDPGAGAVGYSRSEPFHPPEDSPAVQWHPFLGTKPAQAHEREAARVVEIVRETLATRPDETIAILVRARTHLDQIVPALRKAKVAFRAVDIEPLQGRQVIQDLLAVTRALSHPADRVAWLGLLRAPWCGLTLADLHALAGPEPQREGARRTTWDLIHDPERLAALSGDGRARVLRTRDTLAPYVANRLRGTLRERVESAWLALAGPAAAWTEGDLDDAETFFGQLDALDVAGELPDPAVLEQHLERLYAAPDTGEDTRLQIMTIHKAKGLEFGTVILPGLDRPPRGSDRPLFAWKAREGGHMLMAPIRPTREKGEPAYDYLRALENAAAQHELERLLYVAATRAEHKLHLMGYARLNAEKGEIRVPPPTTLLGKAWTAAKASFDDAIAEALAKPEEVKAPQRIRTELRRLDPAKVAVRVPELAYRGPPPPQDVRGALAFDWVNEPSRLAGTIAHAWMQRIATEGLGRWDAARVASLAPRVARELERAGVPPADRERATARVVKSLLGAITDERGRWVLADYPDARSEYRIRVPGPEGVRLLVIDRMFTHDGRAWIVDYKTSAHEGSDLEAFLDSERLRYAEQMGRYVPAFGGTAGSLGLYFPLVKGWREWDA